VGVSRRSHVLKLTSCDRRFISRQRACSAAAGGFTTAEEKDCDESRENG
jgi:hypothetical protein